jgi:ABC transporter DrrB family efflux protein
VTAIGLADDLQKGIIDRFRTLPMARSAVLIGRTASDLVTAVIVLIVMSLCGLLVGWRIHSSVAEAIGGYAVVLLFSFAMSWIAATIGLAVRSVEVAQSAGLIWLFPVTFVSNVFVPLSSMPSWLQPIAEQNPFTYMVNAARALFLGVPAGNDVWIALLWTLGIIAVFAPLSAWRYRRVVAR